MSNYYVYKNGERCIPILNEPRFETYMLYENTGCTIFRTSNRFPYTFNCIYAFKTEIIMECPTLFIEHLNVNLGIKNVRDVLNSRNVHLHISIVMDSKKMVKIENLFSKNLLVKILLLLIFALIKN